MFCTLDYNLFSLTCWCLVLPNPSAQFRPLLSGYKTKNQKNPQNPIGVSQTSCHVMAQSFMCAFCLFTSDPLVTDLPDSTGIFRRPTTGAQTTRCPKTPTTSPRMSGSRRGRPLPGYARARKPRDSPSVSQR